MATHRVRRTRGRAGRAGLAVLMACGALAAPLVAQAFQPRPWSPTTEAQNFSKVEERQTIYNTPGYQLLLRDVSALYGDGFGLG